MTDETRSASGNTRSTGSREPKAGKFDIGRLTFWLGLALCAFATAAAAVLLPALGTSGRVLLIGVGAAAIVLLIWIMHGGWRRLGLYPEQGAAENLANASQRAQFGFLAALAEPALVSERSGVPVAANEAWHSLAGQLRVSGDNERPPSLDMMFGANPGGSGPLFRLARAAKAGKAASETLPALMALLDAGPERAEGPERYEGIVSALPNGKALWRLRALSGAGMQPGSARSHYIDEAPIGFFSAAGDGRIVYLNTTLRAWLGLSADSPNPRLKDIVRADPGVILRREKRAAQRTEVMLRPRDGVEIPAIIITSWPDEADGDGLSRSVVFTPNIYSHAMAQRLVAESSLRPLRASGDALFESMPFGAARLTGEDPAESLIEDANPNLLHISAGRAVIGKRFSELFLAESGPNALAQAIRDAMDSPQELQLAGDEPRNVHLSITAAKGGAIAYLVDLTEKKKLEARLFQSEKLQSIGQLAGTLAHEFNNWLLAIRLRCDKLFWRHTRDDPSFEDIYGISQTVNEAAQVVQAMLAYSRKQTFEREVLDISEIFSGYNILLRQLMDESVTIELDHGRDLPFVRADRNHLLTAIMNLAVNARDAMVENGGGKLVIRTRRATGIEAQAQGFSHVVDGEYLLIDVADSGPGIPPDILGKIFEPFFTTKEAGKGTGLGLSTVWGVVKQSGGYIYPVSQIGRGTTFKIFLPAYDGPMPTDPSAARSANSDKPVKLESLAGRGRILLVEDEPDVRIILSELLQRSGYEMTAAADGFEAIDLIRSEPAFDLIISDVVMPGMDGPKFLENVRPIIGLEMPVLFITGYTERDFETLLASEKSGRVALLRKPFSLTQVASCVRDELAAARAAIH